MGKYITNVDSEKKVITLNDKEKPTARDDFEIDRYLKAGYTIRWKSIKRTEKAKERAEKKDSVETIIKKLEEFPDLKEKFEEIKKGKDKGHGVFAAKSWYEKEALPEIANRKKETETEKKSK